jgi:signal transduction histidine kinase/ActR/RegA family two-component response regulator
MEALGRRTEDIMRTNRELQEAVAEAKSREAALAESEARYRAARDEAERANRAKDGFLSRMSHELRTPLNAILGFSQLLEMTNLPQDHLESVRHITKAGIHLLDLINEILDISRIASGRLSLATEPVDVRVAVDEAAELVGSLAAKRRIEIRVDDEGSPHDTNVLADRQRLKQVLLNLFSNAIKYNREGGRVTVSWHCSGDMVHVGVADTGAGIPKDRMDRLFSEFDRLGAEQTNVEGTGLGLSLTRSLVQAMGGTITVESEVGTGSVFTVELPAAELAARHDEHGPAQGVAKRPRARGSRTILCIEDNTSNLRLIERIFRQRPEVLLLSAMEGRRGLEMAQERRPDLVLLDVHLPDLPGDEVLRCLRDNPVTQRIPVLVLSGDATPAQAERLLAVGANDYITKPFDMRKLLEAVDELLEDPAGPPLT